MQTITPATALFIKGFTTALLWSECVEIDNEYCSVDKSGFELDNESKATIQKQCIKFIEENSQLLAEYATYIVHNEYNAWERAGHDFALTRNRHGVGYWDRDYKDMVWNKDVSYIGEKLTVASHECGEMLLYIGDDDMLHVYTSI